jgi:twitching motility protein PilT
VLATLHAPSIGHALVRIVGIFEGNAERQVILQLTSSLQGILARELLPSIDRTRRVLAYELLMVSGAIRSIIRENQLHQLHNAMQPGTRDGMILMDNCLPDFCAKCQISCDTAVSRAHNVDRFKPSAPE